MEQRREGERAQPGVIYRRGFCAGGDVGAKEIVKIILETGASAFGKEAAANNSLEKLKGKEKRREKKLKKKKNQLHFSVSSATYSRAERNSILCTSVTSCISRRSIGKITPRSN